MRLTMRCRSAFVATKSSSLQADFFIRRLYFATAFQVLDDILEGIVRFLFSNFKGLNVAGILPKRHFDSLVHKLGNAAFSCSRLQTQRTMQQWVKIDGGSFLGGFIHSGTLTLLR